MSSRCLCLCLGFCLLVWAGGAQTLSGTLTDTTGHAVSGAAVVLLDGTSIVAYAFSDAAGSFSLALPMPRPRPLTVVARRLGCTESRYTLAPDSLPRPITLVLRCGDVALPELKIEADPPAVRYSGDTTTYRADAYRAGTERGAGELLDRIPGFQRTGGGRYKYQGKPVQYVFLDGVNLLGTAYEKTLGAVPARAVENVQVIENFDEDYVIKEFTGDNDNVAVNLQLYESYRKALTGNASAEVGAPYAWDGGINVLSTGGRHKQIAAAGTNNLGTDLYEDAVPQLPPGAYPAATAAPSFSRHGGGYSSGILPEALTTLGEKSDLSLGTTGPLARRWVYELGPSASYRYARYLQQNTSELLLDTTFLFNTADTRNISAWHSQLDWKAVGNLGPKKRLAITGNVAYSHTALSDAQRLDTMLRSATWGGPTLAAQQAGVYSVRTGPGAALRITAGLAYARQPFTARIDSADWGFAQQRVTQTGVAASARLEWFAGRAHLTTVHYDIRHDQQELLNAEALNESLNTTRWQQHIVKAAYRYLLRRKMLTLEMQPGLTLFSGTGDDLFIQDIFFTPRLSGSLKLNKRNTFSFSVSHEAQPVSIDYVRPDAMVTGIINASQGARPEIISTSLFAYLRTKYTHSLKQLEIRNTFSYQQTRNGFVSDLDILFPLTFTRNVQTARLIYTALANSYIQKYIAPLKAAFSTTFSYSYSVLPIVFGGATTSYTVQNGTIELSMLKPLTEGANVSASVQYRGSGTESDFINQWKLNFQFDWHATRWTVRAAWNTYRIGQQTDFVHFPGFRVSYKLTPTLDLLLRGENLLNNTNFTRSSVDAASASRQSIQVRSRYLVAGLNVQFGNNARGR